ncbi:MAG: PKD domain-containing protein [Flavobacteriales bacterium]|nr:PKD domain-containing protein [Flavobacteriales bacterium]
MMSSIKPRLLLPLFALAVLISGQAFGQVTADFSAPLAAGCSPLIVNFQNQSTGAGLTYQWDLGNGNNSSAENPSASYITPGSYTVTLTVTGPGGTDTEVKTAFVTVFTPPDPNISASQNMGCFPFAVQFTDESVPGDSPISSWSWDFGDGGVSTSQNPTHTYTTSGTFNVTLLLTDANGCASNQTFPGFINSNSNSPFAGFDANPQVGCIPPVDVNFANLSFGGTAPLTYAWDFGDGNSSTQTTPVHAYTAEGVYDVSLTVTDQLGCQTVSLLEDFITIVENPVIDFSVPDPVGCLGSQMQFTDLSSPPPTSWQWDFGDGGTSTLQSPSHLYTTPGTYTVTLTASYAGSCQGTEVKTDYITIGGIPFVAFTPDQNAGCETPFPVNFTNNSIGAGLSYQWNFGDGGTSTLTSPSHTYTTYGSYTVSLTATNPQGCSTTQTSAINVTQTAADFLPDVFGFCTPLEVNFTDQSTSATAIVSYEWDFGDGGTSTLANPTYTYADTGRFTVSLIITNALGCTDTLVRPNYIFSYTPPNADFDQTPQVICAGDFQFTNFSTGATDWFWDFGDETTGVDEHPLHNYSDTGYFSITLIALNNGCADTVYAEDMLYVSPPIAHNDITFNCADPNTFTFTNNSVGDDTFSWEFGDGNTNSTDNTITYTYAAPGTYFVDLTVTNDTSGCTDTDRDTVYVTQLNAAFTQNLTQGCAPLLVSFTDQSTDAVSWQWDFFGGALSASTQNPNRTFSAIGIYDVRLVVTDINGCTDTTLVEDLITATGAAVAFAVDTAFGCDDLTVTFADQTTPAGSIVSWLWNFGDGATSTDQHPTHIYNGLGSYNVTLTTTDNAGCVNTATVNGAVQGIELPTPAFSGDAVLGCVGDVFTFTNESSVDAVNFLWEFGDGSTSTAENPTHSYGNVGDYTVSLTVFNSQGCDSTVTVADYINIQHPDADFTAFPTFAFCPPLLVSFTDQSSADAVSWQWDFGNGSSSSIRNPSHIYNQSGIYTVTLVVTNANGCTDTIVMPDLITLSGPSGDFNFFPDTVGCPPYEITYQSNATNASQYTWDFGDGALGNGASATHLYTEVGSFIPTLILRDDNGCTFTFQSTDTLQVAPLGVDAGSDVTICQLDAVQLGASGGDTYSWFPPIGLSDPNSGSPFANPSVTTQYIVTVQLLACQNTDTLTVFVNPTPQSSFSTGDVCFGDSTHFADGSAIAAPDSIVSWNWDLGQTLSNDTNPVILYDAPGIFDISLVVTSSSGCSDTSLSTVTVNPAPMAAFAANDTCLFNPTFFTDQSIVSSGSITLWQWDFGNGATSLQPGPTVTYSQDSTYIVTLVVTAEGGCTDTFVRPVNVFPLPLADFVAENVCFGEEVLFMDSSDISTGSIASWTWVFGDGNGSAEQSPSHLYDEALGYVVSLTVTSDHGCTSTVSNPVQVRPLPVSAFTMSSEQSCFVPASVNFFSESQGATTLEWDLANGETPTASNVSTTYDTIGQYNVQLVATNQFGCTDTLTQLFQVFPTVIANFTWSDPTGCEPWTVDFENLSQNAFSYRWNFGEPGGSVNADPVWIFENPGDFSVTLVATGAGGCTDSITYSDIVSVYANPVADFEYTSVLEPVPAGIVAFTNTSTPSWAENTWQFGDGGTSFNNPASHQYDFFGNKLVTLSIIDANGCVDTIMRYVSVDFFGTLYVPNAMVVGDPDPQASIFLPKGRGLLNYRCMIFDKWGTKVWESTALENGQPAEGWDGRYRGESVPQGAYVWKIDGMFTNGEVWEGQSKDGSFYQAGTVTVIR